MRILVDSDWIINCISAVPAAVDTLKSLEDQGLAISSVTMAEVLEGAYRKHNPDEVLSDYRHFLRGFTILPVTEAVAETFARTRSTLRKQGNLIPDMDLMIASTAVANDLTLLTRNVRHFERVPGLKLYRAQV